MDLHVTVVPQRSQHEVRLGIEARRRMTPLEVLSGVSQWRDVPGGIVRLLCCPYISPRVAEICEKAGLSYLDKAGNCRLSGPGLFVLIKGRPNPYPDTRALSNPFAPKSSRIVRLLLQDPEKQWHVQELAREADVSIGLVSKAKNILMEQGYLWVLGGFLRLSDPAGLLRAWAAKYDNKAERHDLYVMGKINEVEQCVQRWCDDHDVKCGLADLAGAWRMAPMVRYNKPTFYVENAMHIRVLGELMGHLDAKRVQSGANLSLWMTVDPSVFWCREKLDDLQVVSGIQLYLDLTGKRGRGEEAAQEVYDRCLAETFGRVDRRSS